MTPSGGEEGLQRGAELADVLGAEVDLVGSTVKVELDGLTCVGDVAAVQVVERLHYGPLSHGPDPMREHDGVMPGTCRWVAAQLARKLRSVRCR